MNWPFVTRRAHEDVVRAYIRALRENYEMHKALQRIAESADSVLTEAPAPTTSVTAEPNARPIPRRPPNGGKEERGM